MKLTDIILEAETDAPVKVVGLAPLDSDSNAAVSKAVKELDAKEEKTRERKNKKAREARAKKKAATINAIQEKAKKKAYDHNRYIQKQLKQINKGISDTYTKAFETLSAEAASFAWHYMPYMIPNLVDRSIGSLKNEFVADPQQVSASIKDPDALIPISAPMKAKMKEWNEVEVPKFNKALKAAQDKAGDTGDNQDGVTNNSIISPKNSTSDKDNNGRTYHQAPKAIFTELANMYATAWDARCDELLSDDAWMEKTLDELAKKYFDDRKSSLPSNKASTKGLDKLTTGTHEILVKAAKEALETQKSAKDYTGVEAVVEKVKADIKKANDTAGASKTGAVDTRKGASHTLGLLLATHEGRIVTAQKALATAKDKTDTVTASAESAIAAFQAKTIKATAYNKAINTYTSNVKAKSLNNLKIKNNTAVVKLIKTALSNLKENLFTGTLKSLLK